MRDVYGPLARMWSYLEEINSSRDKTVVVDIDTLLTCTQQTVLLLIKPSILCYLSVVTMHCFPVCHTAICKAF